MIWAFEVYNKSCWK